MASSAQSEVYGNYVKRHGANVLTTSCSVQVSSFMHQLASSLIIFNGEVMKSVAIAIQKLRLVPFTPLGFWTRKIYRQLKFQVIFNIIYSEEFAGLIFLVAFNP